MKIKLIAFLVSLALIGVSAHATDRWTNTPLSAVYPMANGDFVLVLTVDAPNCTGSGPAKYLYVTVGANGVTAVGSTKMYAAALTAFSMGKPVQIVYDDSTSYCYVNRLLVTN